MRTHLSKGKTAARQLCLSIPSRPLHPPLSNRMLVQPATPTLVQMRLPCSLLQRGSPSLLTVTTPLSDTSPCDTHPLFLPIMWFYMLLGLVLTLKYLLMILEPNLTPMLIQLLWAVQPPVVLHDYEQPVCVHGYTTDIAPMTIVTLSLQQSPMTTQRQGTHTCSFSIKQFPSAVSQHLLYCPCSCKTLASVLMTSLSP